jgi:hypothetical protein
MRRAKGFAYYFALRPTPKDGFCWLAALDFGRRMPGTVRGESTSGSPAGAFGLGLSLPHFVLSQHPRVDAALAAPGYKPVTSP